jgi:alpha-1,6-mannosyltransferase
VTRPAVAPEPAPASMEALAVVSTTASGARRAITALGVLNVAVMSAYTVSSYGFARIVPFGTPEPIEARVLGRLADAIAPAGSAVNAFLRGESVFAAPTPFFLTYALFLLVPSLAFVALLAVLSRHRRALDDATARRLFRWSAAFACALALAHPVLVQDFWLSAGWGELVSRGTNPYYVNLDPQVTEGLPLDYLGLLMTYGPLWALVSGGVMTVSGGSALAAGLLFKGLLVAMWIGALALIARLLAGRPPAERCAGMAVAGWLPLGAYQIAAEGHNDAGMVFLVLLWLVLLERARPLAATAALAGSVLIKYLSAPLFLLDLLHLMRARGRPWTAYVPHAALAATMGIGVFAIFFRSPAFFESTVHMAEWHFLTPRDAVVATGRLLGIEPSLGSLGGVVVAGLAVAVQLCFVALIPVGIRLYWRNPGVESFRRAALLITAGILFGIAGHLWPWFLTWGVALAALQPSAAVARFTVGVALAVPFAVLQWTTFPGAEQLTRITPLLYLFAVGWYVLAPRRWFGVAPEA